MYMAQFPATILLLSSEPVARSVVGEALTVAGHVVLATGDLGKAVDILAETPVDLLIISPYIGNIPGHEAAKYLRGKNPSMLVLELAGLPADDRVLVRAEVEKFELFPAPYPVPDLVKKVAAVLQPRH
jgi:DNA-binding response OmpR family regulator